MKIKDIAEKYNISAVGFEEYVSKSDNSFGYTKKWGGSEIGDYWVEKAVQAYEAQIEEKRKTASTVIENAKAIEERKVKIDSNKIIVTTGDLKQDYDVIGPVYFQVSNKGIFGSTLATYVEKYEQDIKNMRASGVISKERADWGFLYGEWSVGQNDFDKAFYVATQELKVRAAFLGADAIIGMRQDIDLDTNGFAFFYLQMYGTAVKFK